MEISSTSATTRDRAGLLVPGSSRSRALPIRSLSTTSSKKRETSHLESSKENCNILNDPSPSDDGDAKCDALDCDDLDSKDSCDDSQTENSQTGISEHDATLNNAPPHINPRDNSALSDASQPNTTEHDDIDAKSVTPNITAKVISLHSDASPANNPDHDSHVQILNENSHNNFVSASSHQRSCDASNVTSDAESEDSLILPTQAPSTSTGPRSR